MVFVLLFTTVMPSKATAVEYPSVNIVWICDLSASMGGTGEALHNAYNLFTGLFDGIVCGDSRVVIMRDDTEPHHIRPWGDTMTFNFDGLTNVALAFHRAQNLIYPVLSGSNERMQLLVFSNLCQTLAIDEAREQVSCRASDCSCGGSCIACQEAKKT
jgi:hypothetical protein